MNRHYYLRLIDISKVLPEGKDFETLHFDRQSDTCAWMKQCEVSKVYVLSLLGKSWKNLIYRKRENNCENQGSIPKEKYTQARRLHITSFYTFYTGFNHIGPLYCLFCASVEQVERYSILNTKCIRVIDPEGPE